MQVKTQFGPTRYCKTKTQGKWLNWRKIFARSPLSVSKWFQGAEFATAADTAMTTSNTEEKREAELSADKAVYTLGVGCPGPSWSKASSTGVELLTTGGGADTSVEH